VVCVFAAAFMTKEVPLTDATIKFEIWDTAGQERYHSLAPMYYRGAAAAVIVFDLTEPASFERAKAWVSELRHSGEGECVLALAGNKCDLPDRKIDLDEVREYARENKVVFFETSAKSGKNIAEMFTALAERVPRTSDDEGMIIPDEPLERSGGCCGGGR
jgi:small GTP-binding protein